MDNRKWESGASANPPDAAAATSSGHPTDGDPLTSVPPTIPGAYWFYQLGEELRAIQTAAGITPDKANLTQLLTALRSAGVFTTPAQFDNTTKAATTAFVQRALGNNNGFYAFGGATTLTAAHAGGFIQCNSGTPFAVNLPQASACVAGSRLEILNVSTGAVTLNRQGSDTINTPNLGSLTSLVLNQGESVVLELTGTIWYMISGSASLAYALSSFGASLAASGYQKLPSGLILQWGSATAVTTGTAVTLPVAFPTACRAHGATVNAVSAPTQYLGTDANTTTITIYSNSGSAGCRWWAIGY